MTVFANKDAFVGLGLEKVEASPAHISQDCSICTKPLAVHHKHASPQSLLRGFHEAVRIAACGHMHGGECLSAWLSTGNSCPTCKRILFETNSDTITQEDVNEVVCMLGPHFGEARVMVAVANMIRTQEKKHADAHHYHEQEVAKQKMKKANVDNSEFLLGNDDFLDIDEEMDFENDDDEGENGDDEYIDDGDLDDYE